MVSVPALHDAMGISIETVAPEEGEETEKQQPERVDLTQTATTTTTTSSTNVNVLEQKDSSNQQ